jgi:hypothetical protein
VFGFAKQMTHEIARAIIQRHQSPTGDGMAPKDSPRVDESTKLDLAAEERYQKARKELKAEWDRRLRACFDAPDFRERVDAVMNARGSTKKRPKAGSSY